MRTLLLAGAILLLSAACGDNRGEKQPLIKDREKSCVDAPPGGNLKACFATPGEYARFKSCYLLNENAAKCYAQRNQCPERHALVDDACVRQCVGHAALGDDGECHPLPVACPEGEGWVRDETGHCSELPSPPPDQPTYPADAHFQFDYIVRPLTDDQRNRIRHGVLDMTTLIDREVCRFTAQNAAATPAVFVRQRGANSNGQPVFSIRFEMNGSSTCNSGRVTRFQVELRDVAVGHSGLTAIDREPKGFVVTTQNDYLLAFDWPDPPEEFRRLPAPVVYFGLELPAYGGVGAPLIADFEFLAREEGSPGVYMMGFYGHMSVE